MEIIAIAHVRYLFILCEYSLGIICENCYAVFPLKTTVARILRLPLMIIV